MGIDVKATNGKELRDLVRSGKFPGQTAGQAPDFLQGNVVILPKNYAPDFLQYCLNNPKPCPLIGLSKPGKPKLPELGNDVDIRFDVPRYRVYREGALIEEVTTIETLWTDDMVTFVLGCSFSFEEALIRDNFEVRHINLGCNVPMFKCNIETVKSGIFEGPLVVSMRPYKAAQVPAIFDLCANYPHAHGTPVYWGDPQGIGIFDLNEPDYGEPVPIAADEVPVFWACGVTPQAAIEQAKPALCITHAPGHMLVSDIRSHTPISPMTGMMNFQPTA